MFSSPPALHFAGEPGPPGLAGTSRQVVLPILGGAPHSSGLAPGGFPASHRSRPEEAYWPPTGWGIKCMDALLECFVFWPLRGLALIFACGTLRTSGQLQQYRMLASGLSLVFC